MTQWNIDASHSNVGFSVRHMVFAKVNGRFKTWTGTLDLDEGDFTKSKVDISVDVNSIDTHDEKRDGHLKSPDFFDAAGHPSMTFKGKKIEKKGGEEYKLTGDLTIRGATKEVTLDVEYGGRGKDPWGGERVGFHAKGSVNRTDFGLKWNQALETGGVLVGEKVEISIDLEAVKA
jgi:polyisoprenoid-binding protein YceI